MKKLFLFVFLNSFLFYQSVEIIAQEQPADYIIQLSGEKTLGTISRNVDFVQARAITFVDRSGKSQEFTPGQIEGFGLENGRYFASKILPDIQPNVFVQVLFEGKFDLLLHVNTYYIENSLEIVELKPMSLVTQDGNNLERVNNSYFRVLTDHMAGYCGTKLKSEILDTKLIEPDLVRLLVKYHSCEDSPYTLYVQNIPKSIVRPILLGGISIHSLMPNSVSDAKTDNIEKPNTFNLQGLLRIYSTRKYPRLSFDLGLGYSTFKTSMRSKFITGARTYTSHVNLEYTSFYVPGFVNYSLVRSGKTDLYVGLGILFRRDKLTSKNVSAAQIDPNGTIRDSGLAYLKQTYFNPGMKVGVDIKLTSKLGLIGELQLDYLPENYIVSMRQADNLAIYNRLITSFMLGVRF